MESGLWNTSGEYKFETNEILWKSKNVEPNMCLESVNQITVWRVNTETCVESVSMKKKLLSKFENFEPNMCLESVNQITVWRVNPETCVESVSMKKKTSVKIWKFWT